MNRPLPECMPCVMRFKDPAEQINYMFYMKLMLELGFSLDTDNNIYTRLVDDKTMAYLTTIYSKEEIYDYVKGCLEKGFTVTSGPKAPSLEDLKSYQQRAAGVNSNEILDNRGIGIYLENYREIIEQRTNSKYDIEEGIRKGR